MYGKSFLFSKVAIVSSARYYNKRDSKKLLEFLATMPKANSTRITEAQRQRQFISKKFEKYAPSTVYLQVLGSGARGAPNTLYLFTDQKRYMFNCGECTQRLAHEHKVRLSRLDHIFITNKTWRNIGGLPGLSLTLQDVGVPNITLHGPEGLDELYNATRRFVIMKDMKVTMAKCSPSDDFEDNVMSVKYVLMSGSDDNILQTDPKPVHKKPKLAESPENQFEEFLHDDTDYYRREGLKGEGTKTHNIKPKPKPTFDRDPLKKKTEKVLYELQKQTHSCVAYICTLKKRFGTLDLEKCVELGVKPGPMLGQLKSGHDVILPDGTLVLSKTVKTPDDPGPVFIVLEVPELSYLQEAEFSQHFDNGTNPQENIPTLIVHYTPPHVFHHPTYRAFMDKFGSTASHLVLNAQNACLGSEAVHRTQHKLHLLDADIFPLLRDVSVPATWAPAAPGPSPAPRPASPLRLRGLDDLKNKIAVAQFQNIINMEGSAGDGEGLQPSDSSPKLDLIAGRTLTMFHLRPKRQLDRSAEPKLHIQDYIQETMDIDGFVGSLEQFRKLVDGLRYAKNDLQKEYPKVVFLGTGSCIPSKTRNTSAIVLQIDEHRSMLLDCGEGTFGQLVRFYGPKRVNAFMRTLKAIYISHLHADHHIGLIGVLQARRHAINEMEGPSEALYLLAPGQIVSWLSIYDQQFESIRNEFTLIPNQNLLKAKLEEPTNTEMTAAVLSSIGVQHIDMCLVSHCPNAFGVAIQVDEQNKITYSGDTIPCDKLVNIGQDSTLLIHEATMEDELADEARMKMHSTTSQAIDIGRQMNAKYTVLTHFSQRYARLPRLNAHILNDNNSVGIAFDNMQITMSDLDLLPHMYAPLQLMFAEHCVELELKAAHRARQKEKRPSSPDIDTPVSAKKSHCRPDTSSSLASHFLNHRESSITRQKPIISKTGNSKQSCRSKSSSPTKISNRKATSPNSERRSASSVKSKEMAPSSTTSETSDIEKVEVLMTNQTITDSYVVNTHSKTLHTTSKEMKDVRKYSSPRYIKKPVTSSVSPPRPNLSEVSGYGKAMVTPINKRLVLQRDNNRTMSAGSDRTSICFGRKQTSTTSWKENRHSSSPTPMNSREASKPKLLSLSIINIVASILLLYHFMFWKLHNLVSWLSYIQWQFLITVITVGYLFWTAAREMSSANDKIRGYTKSDSKYLYAKSTAANGSLSQSINPQRTSLSPRRRSVERKSYETRNSSPNAKIKTAQMVYSQNARILNSGTPLSDNFSRNRIPAVRNGNSTKENLSPTQAVSQSRSMSRENQNGRFQRSQLCRNIKPTINTTSNHANHSSRSFKPQLEDIKSSYLLLNQREIEKNIKKQVNNVKNGLGLHSYEFGRVTDYWLDIKVKEVIKDLVVSKPPLLNENNRQSILKESMRKFRTKQFWNDSKYEKIEGLNWISWK